MHLQNHNVSKSSITTLFLTTICSTEARRLHCALTDWPYAQVSFIPFIHPNPEFLLPVGVTREGPFSSTDSLGVTHGSLFCCGHRFGVECLHVVDATTMMLQQYNVVRGPMCEARCGPRIQRIRPVFCFALCICVSACDSYGTVLDGPHLRPGCYKGCGGWGEIFHVRWTENVC